MFYRWLNACDSLNADVRMMLLDFKKAFDFVDHTLLIVKLYSLSVKFKLFLKLADCSSGSTPKCMPGAMAIPCSD